MKDPLDHPGTAGKDDLLYWREDLPPYRWFGPRTLPASPDGLQLASGYPDSVQVRQPAVSNNFELVTPLEKGGLARYTRANSLPATPWEGPSIFGRTRGPVDAVSLIQSTFKLEPSGIGNLELVAQARGQLFHFWFDNPINPAQPTVPWDWFGPWVVTG